jgi:fructosamine-3-kinase
MPDWSAIISQLETAGVRPRSDATPSTVSGGDISSAWRLATENGDLFIKTGPASSAEMFDAEAEGLTELASTDAIRVPNVVASGQTELSAYLGLEWMSFERADAATERLFGEQLATLHHTTQNRYGWHRNNTIGLTPQENTWRDNWLDFFREQRLGFQLRLAAENGYSGELQQRGRQLLKRLPVYFDVAEPAASLLHGDLWGGNWGCSGGQPVIFDPAVYYGDREMDIAMTKLFGGFGAEFYAAYESSWPLQDGHQERQHLYQLYHVLNHLNLFGSAYLGHAVRLLEKLH